MAGGETVSRYRARSLIDESQLGEVARPCRNVCLSGQTGPKTQGFWEGRQSRPMRRTLTDAQPFADSGPGVSKREKELARETTGSEVAVSLQPVSERGL
jgi:hypothetical protein